MGVARCRTEYFLGRNLMPECQIVPKLWDAVRFESDYGDGYGHFILTEAVVPPKMNEISLKELFNQSENIIAENKVDIFYKIAFLFFRGGCLLQMVFMFYELVV